MKHLEKFRQAIRQTFDYARRLKKRLREKEGGSEVGINSFVNLDIKERKKWRRL